MGKNIKQVKKMMNDIQFIKKSINTNTAFIRMSLFPHYYKGAILMFGCTVIIFCLSMYFLIQKYTAYAQIPEIIRVIWFILGGSCLITAHLLSHYSILKPLKKLNPKYTVMKIHLDIMQYPFIIHTLYVIYIITGLLTLYTIKQGHIDLIVPVIAIGIGLKENIIGSFIQAIEHLILGYWLLVTGCISLFFSDISFLIGFCYTLGIGAILFGIITSSHSHKEEE